MPASVLSILYIFLGTQITIWIGLLLLAIFIFSLLRTRSDLKPASVSTVLIFTLTIFFSLLLRLASISDAVFPAYFDSAFHFSVIKNIMEHNAAWIFQWLTVNQYHINFHFLTAFLSSTSHIEITQTMLVLGQVFLAFMPFSLFFPVKRVTRSDMAAWFAVILAAFGWYMPAHAVDWGKYPALMSLGLIIFVINLAFLFSQTQDVKKRRVLYPLLGLSILLTVFTHSRSLIIFGIIFLSWITSSLQKRLSQRWQTLVLIGITLATVVLILFVQKQEILTLVFDPYLVKGPWMTVLVLSLAVFALKAHTQLIFACILSVSLLLVSLFVPVAWLFPSRNFLTLLDRPFVEMILFLHLSLLGGLGLAGLEEKLHGRFPWGRYVGLLMIGLVALNAFFTYNLYPSSCCVIVGRDDVVAMDWVSNQLPVKSRIGISSTVMKVNISDVIEGIAGSDAGIWIAPLTGRETMSLPYDMDFGQSPALEMLCQNSVDHIFVGEVGQTFDVAQLDSRPEWYRPLFMMSKTRVYEVIGCAS
ncbi:MAG: hypothetical protein IPP66_02420 [Anaerolineales bacterium]|nr:hypothetical protein [Anaerolineales bacterium]